MNHLNKSILSANDCQEIIKNYLYSSNNQIKILDYDVKPFSNNSSCSTGHHLLIQIKFELKNKEESVTFFGKCLPSKHKAQSECASSVSALTNELFTYKVLFHKFKSVPGLSDDFAPKFYYGRADGLLVFENLSEQGFKKPEPNSLPISAIRLFLKTLARFHAGSIGYQELKTKQANNTRYKLIDEYVCLVNKDEQFLSCSQITVLKNVIDLLPPPKEFTREAFKEKLDNLAKNVREISKPNENFYNVVCHGDMWAKNVMFRYENSSPVECKLINFQLQRYAPPAYDVLQFVYFTTSKETRQHHFHDLLNYYHQCLKKELSKVNLDINTIIPYEEFENSVHFLLPLIKLRTAHYYSFRVINPDSYKRVTSDAKKSTQFDLLETDASYSRLLRESFTELQDLISHHKITNEDCFKIIKNKLNTTQYNLLNYFVKPLGRISGFLGDHYKLKIDIVVKDSQKTLNLFVKCTPDNQTRYNLAVKCGAFMKETFMLTQIFPLIKTNGIDAINECTVPCHLTRLNDVIVFDDLEYDGFQPINPRKPFGLEELQIVLKKLAIYHACNIAVEEKVSQNTGSTFRFSQFENEMQESFFPEEGNDNPSSLSIKTAIASVPHQIDLFYNPNCGISKESFKAKAKKTFERVYELIKPSKKFRNVVCHGDLWASNFLIKYLDGKPVDCRIIDYQIFRYCPPAHDLMCVLYLTTTKSVRTKFLNHLIDYYYQEFTNVLREYDCDVQEIYSRENFLESCEYMIPQAVCQTAIYYHFTMTDSDLMKEYTATDESTNKIFLVDRREFITDMCRKDSIYKQRMQESIEDLLEMCVKYF